MSPLTGRVAIVTGANHGIGEATARLLANEGVAVLLNYLRIDDEADLSQPEEYRKQRASDASRIVQDLESAGCRAVAVEADLSDPEAIPFLFDEAERLLGPVDILINNASSWLADTFVPDTSGQGGQDQLRVSASSFDRQFSVDARATALLVAEFARRHIDRNASWGRIVSLTSGGETGFPGEVSYGAAKAALENYTFSAAVELAGWGVTANIVHPPVTDTGWVTDEIREFVSRSPHLQHIADPIDVANVICFLVSDDAAMISANVLKMW